jgi:arylsulfatase A-like enzyme
MPLLHSIGRTLAIAGITALGLACRPAPAPQPPRNVILIVVDTLRADHLGYHGHPRATSGRLDRLAERSAVFLNHQAHSSRTGPSVASLFTSLHVRSHGVVNPLDQWDGKGILVDERLTLAEMLAGAGYECRGLVANPNLYPQYGFAQGFDTYRPVPMAAPAAPILEAAAGWLSETSRPFFLYVHLMDPHSPYSAPLPAGFGADPDYSGPVDGSHTQLDQILAGDLSVGPDDERRVAELYDAEIAAFDAALGTFLARLDEHGLREQSILILTSDHGEELFEHGAVLHGYTLYREQLHVPLLVHAPGLVQAGSVTATTRNIDVLPTLLELLGLPAADSAQGRSLVPLLVGGELPAAPVLAETRLRAVKTVRVRSFESGGHKLIESLVPEGPAQLFDVSADPGETKDLSQSAPKTLERLERERDAFLASLPEVVPATVRLDAEALERLRALGYVESGG